MAANAFSPVENHLIREHHFVQDLLEFSRFTNSAGSRFSIFLSGISETHRTDKEMDLLEVCSNLGMKALNNIDLLTDDEANNLVRSAKLLTRDVVTTCQREGNFQYSQNGDVVGIEQRLKSIDEFSRDGAAINQRGTVSVKHRELAHTALTVYQSIVGMNGTRKRRVEHAEATRQFDSEKTRIESSYQEVQSQLKNVESRLQHVQTRWENVQSSLQNPPADLNPSDIEYLKRQPSLLEKQFKELREQLAELHEQARKLEGEFEAARNRYESLTF